MNKLFCLLLALLVSLCIPFCACAEESDQTVSPLAAAEQEIMDQLLETMGEDLIQRAKDGGFQLKVDFTYGKPKNAGEGEPLTALSVEIDIRSAMGTVLYKANTVDCDLLAELEFAALEAILLKPEYFALTEEDAERFRQYRYTTDTRFVDVYSEDGSVNLHVNETPNNQAIVLLRHWDPDWKTNHTILRLSSYDWDGLTWEADL